MRLALVFPLLLACTPRPAEDGARARPDTPAPAPRPAAVPTAADDFATALLGRHAALEPAGANVLLSPTSLALALRLVTEGATGATRDSLAGLLGFAGAAPNAMREASRARLVALGGQDDVTLGIATALWSAPDRPLAPAFLEVARRAYDAQATSTALSTPAFVERVNAWGSNATRGRIPRVLDRPLTPDHALFLANAVYFKGRWAEEFAKDATRPLPFTLAGGTRVDVPQMAATRRVAYRAADGVRVARLPYRGDRFAMYVLLADSGRTVDDAVRALTPALLRDAAAAPRRELQLRLPSFTLAYRTQLVPTLTAMGAGIAFGPQADFSRLFAGPTPPSSISRVQQDVFVQVNEEGTEAAAVTSIGVRVTSVAEPPPPFFVDRPFVFAIRDDRTGEVLFTGRVMDPRGDSR